MRVTLVGTVGNFSYNHEYDIIGYAPYAPSPNEKSERFANCVNQSLIFNAVSQVAQNTALPIIIQNNITGLLILVLIIGIVLGILGSLGALYAFKKYRAKHTFMKLDDSGPAGAQRDASNQ